MLARLWSFFWLLVVHTAWSQQQQQQQQLDEPTLDQYTDSYEPDAINEEAYDEYINPEDWQEDEFVQNDLMEEESGNEFDEQEYYEQAPEQDDEPQAEEALLCDCREPVERMEAFLVQQFEESQQQLQQELVQSRNDLEIAREELEHYRTDLNVALTNLERSHENRAQVEAEREHLQQKFNELAANYDKVEGEKTGVVARQKEQQSEIWDMIRQLDDERRRTDKLKEELAMVREEITKKPQVTFVGQVGQVVKKSGELLVSYVDAGLEAVDSALARLERSVRRTGNRVKALFSRT